jgi:TRAP-type C4-dicarboxylate transport system permease small subunit
MNAYGVMKRLNRFVYLVGGIAIVFMTLITVADVFGRKLGHPLVGTYELVGLAGAVVIGFCIPYTTSLRSHITVDFVTMKLPPRAKVILLAITRALGVLLWSFVAFNLFLLGGRLHGSGEVSLTLQIPTYPVAYGVGVCCWLQAVTQVVDFVDLLRGKA